MKNVLCAPHKLPINFPILPQMLALLKEWGLFKVLLTDQFWLKREQSGAPQLSRGMKQKGLYDSVRRLFSTTEQSSLFSMSVKGFNLFRPGAGSFRSSLIKVPPGKSTAKCNK